MNRPPSIVRFEQLYLVSIALHLLAIALSWKAQQHALATDPRLAEMTWFLPGATILRVVVAALLWWLVARRGNVVAKWVVVVFAAFSVVGLLTAVYGLVQRAAGPLTSTASIVSAALYIWAATMLFRADTRPWFGELPADEPHP